MPRGIKHTKETYFAMLFARHSENKKKYNYDKSVFVNVNTRMVIFCNVCGETFSQTPDSHFEGKGCLKCAIAAKTKTHSEFVEEANRVHNNEYNYLSQYVNNKTKMQMQHKSCGNIFPQQPHHHTNGQGCPECGLVKVAKANNENAKIISDAETEFYINNAVWNSYKRSAKERNLAFDIAPEDILELYKKQNGLCAFTGAKLICNSTNCGKNNWSIDRVYNNIGYKKDNIMLVTKTANMVRNRSTIKELLEFCNMVVSVNNAIQKYTVMPPEEKAERLENHSIRFSKKKD